MRRKPQQQTGQERIARIMAKRADGIFLDKREIEKLRIIEKTIHEVLLLADARCAAQNNVSDFTEENFLILNQKMTKEGGQA